MKIVVEVEEGKDFPIMPPYISLTEFGKAMAETIKQRLQLRKTDIIKVNLLEKGQQGRRTKEEGEQ